MERGPTLPGVEEDDEDRIVLHVDLDCFYAACERLREPALEGEPLVVGMGYEPGDSVGAVATASYEAREYGVESAQAITEALERLPRAADGEGTASPADDGASAEDSEGVDADAGHATDGDDEPVGYYRPVDMAYYESVAAEVKEILHDVADTVREVSIDEAYLDVTERTDWSVADGYARHVKQRVEREVGLVASVGVAPTMHAAKVAADHDKPDGLVVVEPGEVREFLAPLPVEDLHGIGPVTAGALRDRGIETVADLADADRDWVREQWGDRGLELQDRARGVDPRVVEPRGRPKSLSRESAFAEPEGDVEAVRERLRALADAVADRAQSKDALYRTIGIKVVLPPYDVNTRERSLSGPVDDPELVESVALDLLEEFADESPRKVGVRVSNLEFGAADQSTLGGWDGATVDDASDDDLRERSGAATNTGESGADDAATADDASGGRAGPSAGPETTGSRDGSEAAGVADLDTWADGEQADGEQTDGERTVGEQTDGERIDVADAARAADSSDDAASGAAFPDAETDSLPQGQTTLAEFV